MEAAPVDCWYVQDGCAARTGATATRPVTDPLKLAWSFKSAGDVEQEPLVWGDRIFVISRAGPAQQSLHVLRLADGKPLFPAANLAASGPVLPSVWKDQILLSDGKARLTLHNVWKGGLSEAVRYPCPGQILSTLMTGDLIVALSSEGVTAWRKTSAKPLWKTGPGFRGQVAMRYGVVFATWLDEDGQAFLVAFDARSGGELGREFVGRYEGGSPPAAGIDIRLTVLADSVIVLHPTPVTGGPTTRGRGLVAELKVRGPGSVTFGSVAFRSYIVPPVEVLGGWVGLLEEDDGPHLVHGDSGEDLHGLANPKFHPEFMLPGLPLTACAGAVFSGRRGVALDGYRVLAEGDTRPKLRAVPARRTLLVVPDSHVVEAWRPGGSVEGRPALLGAARSMETTATPARPSLRVTGALLATDGTVFRGDFGIVDGGEWFELFTAKDKSTRKHSREIRVALDATGRPLYVLDLADLASDVAEAARLSTTDEVLRAAEKAVAAGDPELLAEALRAAEGAGAPVPRLTVLRKKVAGWAEKPPARKADLATALRKELSGLEDLQWGATRSALEAGAEDTRGEVSRLFLQALLDREPRNEKARAAVRAHVPKEFPLAADFDARAWLDVAAAARDLRFDLVDPAPGSGKTLTPAEREISAARAYWRKDLFGLRTDQVLVVSPLDRPAPIAFTFALGGMVSKALESMFVAPNPPPRSRDPLFLQIFAAVDEYKKVSSHGRASPDELRALEEIGGYYAIQDGVTRLCVPADRSGYPELARRLARVLADHWMMERCPLYAPQERKLSMDTPGCWVDFGVPSFLEEFVWDLEGNSWRSLDPRDENIDIVASAAYGQLIRWEEVLTMSRRQLLRLDRNERIEVPMRWKLGTVMVTDRRSLFVCQSAVLCSYLHHQEAHKGTALSRALREYYTDQAPKSSATLFERFKVSPDEFERDIVKWARSVQAGTVTAPAGR